MLVYGDVPSIITRPIRRVAVPVGFVFTGERGAAVVSGDWGSAWRATSAAAESAAAAAQLAMFMAIGRCIALSAMAVAFSAACAAALAAVPAACICGFSASRILKTSVLALADAASAAAAASSAARPSGKHSLPFLKLGRSHIFPGSMRGGTMSDSCVHSLAARGRGCPL